MRRASEATKNLPTCSRPVASNALNPMNRLPRRLLLTPRFSAALVHHLLKPAPLCTPKTSSRYSFLCKSPACLFSSQDAGGGQDDPFASFKCYTARDPDTPYHVIEPHAVAKAAPSRAKGSPTFAQSERPNVEHIMCATSSGDLRRCDVYFIGVGSDEAIGDVKEAITFFNPQVIFLELCEHRLPFLALQNLQGNKTIQIQHDALTAAFKEAKESGIKVVLGDRPFDITVRRILESMLSMRIWEFTKLSFFLLFLFVEYAKDNKVFNINEFIRQKIVELKVFPSLLEPIVHERDAYMSSVLAKVAGEHSTVVAVVGVDHIPGIKKQLQQRPDSESSYDNNN